MKKTIITPLSVALWLLAILMAVPLKASAIEENEVTLLKAIKSTGEQAFNTGYTHKANTRIELDCEVTKNNQRDWEALFGARLRNFHFNAFCFFSRHNKNGNVENEPCFNRSGSASNVETVGSNFVYDERIKLVCDGKTATWYKYSNLSTAVASVTTTGMADDGKTPMFLFNLNTPSFEGGIYPDTSPSVMTLYGCKIYEGSTLKCDFVPAIYNNTVGLYNRVNKTFSGSITDKSFEAVASEKNIAIDATNFPDEAFRNYLLSQEYGKDGVITPQEMKNITSIGVAVTANNQQPIQSLQGIEFFTALDSLNCDNNQLTELDLSSNTVLRDLHCNANQLTTLTLPESTTLQYLFCGGNKLTTLDLSKNPNLYILYFCSNQIKDAGMDALVASLPTRESFLKGFFEVIDATDKNEGNKMTTTQVEAAKQKGWNPTYLPKGSNQWQDYPGSDATPANIAIDATNFPNDVFRAYLLNQNYGKDGVITQEEIANIILIEILFPNDARTEDKSIQKREGSLPTQSLKGIEFFTELKGLACTGGNLATLDLSNNTKLESLYCNKNQLTTLDLSKNSDLKWLYCDNNQLTTLDLPENTMLQYIDCKNNQLTTLDLSKSTMLQYIDCKNNQLTTLDLSKSTKLESLYCNNNQLTSLYLTKNSALKQLYCYDNQIKGDAMNALVENLPEKQANNNGIICVFDGFSKNDGNMITSVQVEAAKQKNWNVYSMERTGMAMYNGCDTYPVWVGEMQVTEKNKNNVLGDGKVSYVPSKDAGMLTFAEPISIIGKHYNSKIYANNIDLTINAPKGLTVESDVRGIRIDGDDNTLTINGDLTITSTDTGIDAVNVILNGNLTINSTETGIEAVDVILNGTDNTITTKEDMCIVAEGTITINGKLTATIDNPEATAGNATAIAALSGITISNGYEITEPKNGQIKQFEIEDHGIVEIFSAPADADGKYVPHIVISPAHVHSMKETTGKAPTCTEPGFETYWTCTSCNKMFSDELGENEISAPYEIPALGHIWGEWVVTREATTTQEGEETRTCLNDPSHKETRTIPMLTISGLAIDATNFPDENFRDFLLKQDYGRDGYLTASEIENCTEMEAIFLEATSIKGIEHFTALKVLKCYGNELTELDVTKNTALETLICHNNPLTELDLSNNTALKELDCINNQLTELDLSNNTALLELECSGNPLTTIDLSKNTALTRIECERNQLTALDVSKNTALMSIECSDNKLTEIDITKNVALVVLDCHDNQIHTINVSPDCAALMAIDSRHNQLKGASVDALIENLPTRTANTQGMIGFCVEDDEEGNIMTPEQVAAATQKYWMILYWKEGAKEDDLEPYPGSTTHIQSLERTSTEPSVTENWYDLRGRKLNGTPKKNGLYLQNGHKVMIK